MVKVQTNTSIDHELKERAHRLGINLSEFLSTSLNEAINVKENKPIVPKEVDKEHVMSLFRKFGHFRARPSILLYLHGQDYSAKEMVVFLKTETGYFPDYNSLKYELKLLLEQKEDDLEILK